jgi:hypothetical protein
MLAGLCWLAVGAVDNQCIWPPSSVRQRDYTSRLLDLDSISVACQSGRRPGGRARPGRQRGRASQKLISHWRSVRPLRPSAACGPFRVEGMESREAKTLRGPIGSRRAFHPLWFIAIFYSNMWYRATGSAIARRLPHGIAPSWSASVGVIPPLIPSLLPSLLPPLVPSPNPAGSGLTAPNLALAQLKVGAACARHAAVSCSRAGDRCARRARLDE